MRFPYQLCGIVGAAVLLLGAAGALAALLRRVGRTDEAASLDQNRLELWRHWDHKLPNNPFLERQLARQ